MNREYKGLSMVKQRVEHRESNSAKFWMPQVSPNESSVSEPLLWLKLVKKRNILIKQRGFLGPYKLHVFWFCLDGLIHWPSVCPHTKKNPILHSFECPMFLQRSAHWVNHFFVSNFGDSWGLSKMHGFWFFLAGLMHWSSVCHNTNNNQIKSYLILSYQWVNHFCGQNFGIPGALKIHGFWLCMAGLILWPSVCHNIKKNQILHSLECPRFFGRSAQCVNHFCG